MYAPRLLSLLSQEIIILTAKFYQLTADLLVLLLLLLYVTLASSVITEIFTQKRNKTLNTTTSYVDYAGMIQQTAVFLHHILIHVQYDLDKSCMKLRRFKVRSKTD